MKALRSLLQAVIFLAIVAAIITIIVVTAKFATQRLKNSPTMDKFGDSVIDAANWIGRSIKWLLRNIAQGIRFVVMILKDACPKIVWTDGK
jgi:hypothetical protein